MNPANSRPDGGVVRSFRRRAWCGSALLAVFALGIAGCGQAKTPPKAMDIPGYGRVELLRAEWVEPFDAAGVQRCLKSVGEWRQKGLLDPFRVKVSPEHEIVKAIQRGPVLVYRPADSPDTAIWIPIKDAGKKLLVETVSTRAVALMGPPSGQNLDLAFLRQSP